MKLPYRADIDGLRAVAVICVLLFHADLGVSGGYVGVDVFFVISGYLITGLIVKDAKNGTFSLVEFWERRIRRILPALIVATAATLTSGWILLMPNEFHELGRSAVALSLFGSNFHFWRETNYFGPASDEMPLLQTWSLAVEEQFYIFLPLFIIGLVRLKAFNRFPTALAVAFGASLVLSGFTLSRSPAATFFLLPTRAWELLCGALLVYVPLHSKGRWPTELASCVGMGCILSVSLLYDNNTPFPGMFALPPVLGAALIIWSGGTSQPPTVCRLLSVKPIVTLGLMSYSLYLWHWPLFAYSRYLSIRPLSILERTLLLAASVVLAWISWRLVELPFRNRSLLVGRQKLFSVASAVYASLLVAGFVAWRTDLLERPLPRQTEQFVVTGSRFGSFHELTSTDVPQNLVRLGDVNAQPQVLIWGDSYAMAVLPAIDSLCKEYGIGARAATHSSTAPVVQYYYSHSKYGLKEDSVAFNEAVLGYIRANRIRAVLLVGAWSVYAHDGEMFRDALLMTADKLREAGATVFFMKEVPVFDFNVPKALALFSYANRDLSQISMTKAEYDNKTKSQAGLISDLERVTELWI